MAYSSESASDRLASVRAAIDRCLNAQEFTQRGRSLSQARLKDLRELEKDLMQEVGDSGGSMASVAKLTEPT